MTKNRKRSFWSAVLAVSVTIGFSPVMAQEITITTTVTDNRSADPVDLTVLAQPDADNTTVTETAPDTVADQSPAADADDTATAAVPAVSLTTGGLRQQNPSAIRLASLGITLAPEDNLDRMMWQGSNAATVLSLYRHLPKTMAVPLLREKLAQVVLMRSVPPEGSIDLAGEMVEERLNWLAVHVGGEDLAGMIRQLPDSPEWENWRQWLVLHDLITRNDEAACRLAERRAAETLDAIWHKTNAFCMIIAGDREKAAFALDIMEDRGVAAPIYFDAMRQLTTGVAPAVIDQTGADALDLVLLDSARVDISLDAIRPMQAFAASLGGLRYLEDEAATLIAARTFQHGHQPIAETLALWALQPVADIPAPEALTRFSLAEEADAVALARYHTWQALALEKDAAAAAQLALEALIIDFRHSGSRSLDLWMPFMADGRLNVGPLPGLVPGFERDRLTDEASAWADILAFSARPLTGSTIVNAGALDAVPVLKAAGLSIEGLDWTSQFDETARLGDRAISLPLARLEAIDAAAAAGRRAELIMLTAISLGEMPLHHLSREDATRIITAFMTVGMEQTARAMTADILRGWVLERHLRMAGDADAASS
ncbi:MAG: hypothetical protein ACON4P_06855 [Candidatus Puniceispirillales bacterium]